MLRQGPDGKTYGNDESDPLIWVGSTYFLRGDSRARLERALEDVNGLTTVEVQTCPIEQRVLVQNRIWHVFDYAFDKLAPSEDEIARIANPLADVIGAQTWPAVPTFEGGPDSFLPADLNDPRGAWVALVRADATPLVPVQLRGGGARTQFIVKMRLPDGAGTSESFLQAVAHFPTPWVIDTESALPSNPDGSPHYRLNPELPGLPVGTRLALIRNLAVIDRSGRIRPTALTLSVQLRDQRLTDQPRASHSQDRWQSVAEFRLNTDGVGVGERPKLRAIRRDESD